MVAIIWFRTDLGNVIDQVEEGLTEITISHAQLLGLQNRLNNAVEQLNSLDQESIDLISLEEVTADVLKSMKTLEPTHKLQAEYRLK